MAIASKRHASLADTDVLTVFQVVLFYVEKTILQVRLMNTAGAGLRID